MQGLTILLPKDDPNGLKIIEISDWNGKVFIVPRKNLKDLGEREESSMFGVYFLISEGDGPSQKKIYIGETRNFYQRLTNHDTTKEFWDTAIIFTGSNLDKADVEYLESKSLSLAKEARHYLVVNDSGAHKDKLSEFKMAAMEAYFQKIKFVLSLFGVAIFQKIPSEHRAEEVYYLRDVKNKDAGGKGTLLATNEFVVFAGSRARLKEAESLKKYVASSVNLRALLKENRVFKLAEDGKSYEFTRDYTFHSPSAAADAIRGVSTNGWTAWKDKDGKTLDENKRK